MDAHKLIWIKILIKIQIVKKIYNQFYKDNQVKLEFKKAKLKAS